MMIKLNIVWAEKERKIELWEKNCTIIYQAK